LLDLGFLDKTQLDQGIARRIPEFCCSRSAFPQLFLGDQTLAEEDLTELVLGKGNARRTQPLKLKA